MLNQQKTMYANSKTTSSDELPLNELSDSPVPSLEDVELQAPVPKAKPKKIKREKKQKVEKSEEPEKAEKKEKKKKVKRRPLYLPETNETLEFPDEVYFSDRMNSCFIEMCGGLKKLTKADLRAFCWYIKQFPDDAEVNKMSKKKLLDYLGLVESYNRYKQNYKV